MTRGKTLLFLTAGPLSGSRIRFDGVSRYAAERGWYVQPVENIGMKMSLHDVFSFWKPFGVILEYGDDLPRDAVRHFRGVPVVCLDRDPSWGGICVCQDSHAAGALCARELLRAHDRRSFGYVGFPVPKFWDHERRDGYTATLSRAGCTCSIFDAATAGKNERTVFRKMGQWLSRLPLPCGIMASNDYIASKVLALCRRLGLDVPRDVSVAGVDNSCHVCENTVPTLSSVEPDFEGSGYMAARMIDHLLRGGSPDDHVLRFSPSRLVRRASTSVLLNADGGVAHAVEFIRKNFRSGLRVADILNGMGCSRRSAEMRFRAATGHTIFEEIDANRIEHAKTLLKDRQYTVVTIAGLCGFGTAVNFFRAFRHATGMTPGAWRKHALR